MNAEINNDEIREAVMKAVSIEEAKGPFRLFGRGHESRVTLTPKTAAILRSIKIPRIYISGFGPNYFYPARVFVTARKMLVKKFGFSPI